MNAVIAPFPTVGRSLPQTLSRRAFQHLKDFLLRESGISLGPNKEGMVVSRLSRRLQALGLTGFDEYCDLLAGPGSEDERSHFVSLLTTHETYFFREPAHFDHFASHAVPGIATRPLRVWCAAASSGEEPYSVAMTLADVVGNSGWEVFGTDISGPVLARAARGVYTMDRLHNMPEAALHRHCLRGTGGYAGSMLIKRDLRSRVRFERHNLIDSPATFGMFDVVFLRNVLIYFDDAMKHHVVSTVLQALRPGGWLYTGHAESLIGRGLPVETVKPSIYRKRVTP